MSVLVGVALGVLSRIEETTAGFSAGISSDSAWVAVAFLLGSRGRSAAVAAAVCLQAQAAA